MSLPYARSGLMARTPVPQRRGRNFSERSSATELLSIDDARREASGGITKGRRSELGQVMTPLPAATFMAGMFENKGPHLHLLDAGAGVGSLTAAWVSAACSMHRKPKSIRVTAFEIEPAFLPLLRETIEKCRSWALDAGVRFEAQVQARDFVEYAVESVGDLFGRAPPAFTTAILNPPYKKLNTGSRTRLLLESVNAGTTNLYAAFVALASRLLLPGGELVAITPRSFCNGPYFRSFRAEFLTSMSLQRIHVFEGRNTTFAEDGVLQENVIFHAIKSEKKSPRVRISSSPDPTEDGCSWRMAPLREVVRPEDPDLFIWITPERSARMVIEKMRSLTHSIGGLGLAVSTGRVVDFRARQHLLKDASDQSVPLIYPGHFTAGYVEWPRLGYKKPNAIARNTETETLLVPSAIYTLVKRFSSKEERRRVVASVFDPSRVQCPVVGFENHLNYFHAHGKGLPMDLAKGLSGFLNSTVVDGYFRQFNGHTQVNATDLRSLPYPSRENLVTLGHALPGGMLGQAELDALVDEIIFDAPNTRAATA